MIAATFYRGDNLGYSFWKLHNKTPQQEDSKTSVLQKT